MNVDEGLIRIKEKCDYFAPDSSEIYLLSEGTLGGLCKCVLPAGKTSLAVLHKTVEEIWYFLAGEGEMWRQGFCGDKPAKVYEGTSLFIPPHTAFQFRNTGKTPLEAIITTLPPWPGSDEAVSARGFWQ